MSYFCDVCHEDYCCCEDEALMADACMELGKETITRSEFEEYKNDLRVFTHDESGEPVIDEEWRREIAMEAGMLGGCEAYNEVMGY